MARWGTQLRVACAALIASSALAAATAPAGAAAPALCPEIGDSDTAGSTFVDPPPALGQSQLGRRQDGRVQVGFNDPWARGSGFLSTRLDLQRRGGASLIRYDAVWGEMQPIDAAHAPSWDQTDEVYCEALARGLRPVIVLDTVPWWATDHSAQCPQPLYATVPQKCFMPPAPDHVVDLERFAEQLALRYHEAAAIEAWNEPNLPSTWSQPADRAGEERAKTYAELVLGPIYVGVKSGAPQMPVLGGALASVIDATPPAGWIAMDAFVDALLDPSRTDAARHMDALSIHAYAPSATRQYDAVMSHLDAAIARHPASPRPHLWLTEVGSKYDIPFGAQQAAVLESIYQRINARDDIDAVLFHTLLNIGPSEPDEGYGWVWNLGGVAFSPRRVYCDFAAMLAKPACTASLRGSLP